MRVVDASAVVEVLLQTPRGRSVADRLAGADLAAPDLICVEATSALARLQRAGQLDAEDADAAMDVLASLPISLISTGLLTRRAWELRDRVRVADAFYVACAESLRGALVTCDSRLARASLPGLAILHVQ